MRIGHYAPHIWGTGGIETYVRRTGKAQAERGHAVHFFSRDEAPEEAPARPVQVAGDEELFEKARAARLDVLHLHRPVATLPDDRVPTVRTMHGNQGSSPSGTRYLGRTGEPCDRAYSIAGCLWGHLVDRCASRRPSNIIASFQGIRREHQLAAEVPAYTVSRFLREQMARSGCPMEKVHTIRSPAPEGVAAYEPPPRDGAPRFLFVGRVVPEKGLHWLLRALAQVEAEVHLDVAGDGYALDEARALAEELNIAGRVAFHGWVPSERVEGLMQEARAVVVPSVWHEPAGLVTLEAAALGRPVIASRVGGIPEYALEDFSLLVPPNDTEHLAASIRTLAGDYGKAAHMGRKGRQAAEKKFAMKSFMEKLEAFYEQTMPKTKVIE